jgi:hypothetical protein
MSTGEGEATKKASVGQPSESNFLFYPTDLMNMLGKLQMLLN